MILNVEATLDTPFLKTKPLVEVFEKCNFATVEPNNYYDAAKFKNSIVAMKNELDSINKN